MRKYFKSILFTISILTLFLSISCLEEYVPPTISLDSPEDTLRTFVYAFNHHYEPDAIKILASTLTDDFTFYFDPKDAGIKMDGYIIPDSWNKDEFLTACLNMFNNAYSINLDIPQLETGLKGQYNSNGNEFYCETDINFLLYVSQSQGYQAVGPVDWRFRKCDDGKWRIYAIYDHTSPELFTIVNASWGEILFTYR
jgi:hypothetical protein